MTASRPMTPKWQSAAERSRARDAEAAELAKTERERSREQNARRAEREPARLQRKLAAERAIEAGRPRRRRIPKAAKKRPA